MLLLLLLLLLELLINFYCMIAYSIQDEHTSHVRTTYIFCTIFCLIFHPRRISLNFRIFKLQSRLHYFIRFCASNFQFWRRHAHAYTMAFVRSVGRLDTKHTLFLLCDLQSKFQMAQHFPAVIRNAQKLLTCGKLLDVQLIASEHYPEKLGHLMPELDVQHAIDGGSGNGGAISKTEFSIMANDKLRTTILNLPVLQSVVLFGLEAHICVEQTAMDLLECGYDVHIVADCTTSISAEDRHLAFQRLRQIGCFIATSENVIFKLMRSKDHPNFSQIRPLVTEKSIDTGLAQHH